MAMFAASSMIRQTATIIAREINTAGTALARDRSTAPGRLITPYAMKKAEALSCASTSDRWKMPLTAATSGSTSDVMKPQAKNRHVTIAYAAVTPAIGRCFTSTPLECVEANWQANRARTSRPVSGNSASRRTDSDDRPPTPDSIAGRPAADRCQASAAGRRLEPVVSWLVRARLRDDRLLRRRQCAAGRIARTSRYRLSRRFNNRGVARQASGLLHPRQGQQRHRRPDDSANGAADVQRC